MERVFAAVDIQSVSPTFSAFNSFGDLTSAVVRNAFVLAGVISLFLLIFGGFGIIRGAGSGDAKGLEQSKKTITTAVIGLLIVVTSYWLVLIIKKITGVSQLPF